MKRRVGRKAEGYGTFLRGDGSRVHEYVDVTAWRATDREKATVMVGFENGNDWYQSVCLSPKAARRLADNLDQAARRAEGTSDE